MSTASLAAKSVDLHKYFLLFSSYLSVTIVTSNHHIPLILHNPRSISLMSTARYMSAAARYMSAAAMSVDS